MMTTDRFHAMHWSMFDEQGDLRLCHKVSLIPNEVREFLWQVKDVVLQHLSFAFTNSEALW